MYLILCPEDKRIMHISETIDYEKNGNFILDSGLRVLATIAECEQVEEVPDHVEVEKYLYVNGEFVVNPNYEEVKDDNQRIADLEQQVTDLELALVEMYEGSLA